MHLINDLGAGGAERSLAELLPDLPALDIQPFVVVLRHVDEGVEQLVANQGVELHRVQASGWLRQVHAVHGLLRSFAPDVLHTTIFEADVIGRIASVGRPNRVLTSLVNTSYDPVRLKDPNVSATKLAAVRAIDAGTSRYLSDHFHAISQAVKASAVARLRIPPHRITVVPRGRSRRRLGEPSSARRAAVRSRLGIPGDARIVLHVGREEFQKAHGVLLGAMATVMERRQSVHLVLAGRRGNASAEVDRLLHRLPEARVHRLGHIDDVPDLLAAADLFVFPSFYEGLGGAALEALAMGVPMVVSDIPSLREFLDGVAVFVEPGNELALAAEVDGALTSGPETSRTSLGRQRFDSYFEHGKVVTAMADLFKQVAGS